MKFKIIFILFNIVVFFSLLIITIMPIFMLGPEYSSFFWSESWYFILAFLIVIGIIDVYFLYNWKIFHFLEEERWQDLSEYLESRLKPGRILPGYIVRIMINAYMMNGNLKGIETLGELIKEKKPALFRKLLIPFGIPVILKSNPEHMVEYFKPYYRSERVKEHQWVAYLYGFSLLLQKRGDEARVTLTDLCREKISPVPKLLTLYSLSLIYNEGGEEDDCFEKFKSGLLDEYTPETLRIEIEKNRSNIVVVVLSKLCEEAVQWLFEGKIKEKKE